jgi:hypothetical protein
MFFLRQLRVGTFHHVFQLLFIAAHCLAEQQTLLFVIVFVQTTSLLIVNQNVIDLLASLFMILTALVQVDGVGMDGNSIADQILCRFWLTRFPLWCMLISSAYSIMVLSMERYLAIVHPVFYKVSFCRCCCRSRLR